MVAPAASVRPDHTGRRITRQCDLHPCGPPSRLGMYSEPGERCSVPSSCGSQSALRMGQLWYQVCGFLDNFKFTTGGSDGTHTPFRISISPVTALFLVVYAGTMCSTVDSKDFRGEGVPLFLEQETFPNRNQSVRLKCSRERQRLQNFLLRLRYAMRHTCWLSYPHRRIVCRSPD